MSIPKQTTFHFIIQILTFVGTLGSLGMPLNIGRWVGKVDTEIEFLKGNCVTIESNFNKHTVKNEIELTKLSDEIFKIRHLQ